MLRMDGVRVEVSKREALAIYELKNVIFECIQLKTGLLV